MKNLILVLICIFFADVFSQENLPVGKYEQKFYGNNVLKTRIVTKPLLNPGENLMINEYQNYNLNSVNASTVRWNFIDGAAIGYDVAVSGDGYTGVCGWSLNSKRISTYGNTNNTPVWEYSTPNVTDRNYLSASDTGLIAVGSYRNIYIFNKNSNTPIFNFDLTTLPDTGTAGPIDITSNGGFIVASSYRSDTSTVFGFNKSSTISVWKLRVPTRIYGVRISGNDSLVIVSTYSYYWVINTLTGVVRYSGAITDGTQMTQGISGNGNLIATVNYKGYLKVYQWNGSAYNLLWQYQEAPGTYYNWFTAVDISYDGSYIAGGTLIFQSSSSYDGRLRYFKVSNGSTPLWSFLSLLDEVSWVKFSKNGKILALTSYGDAANTKSDLVIFKTTSNSNVPIYTVNMPGSPYMCDVSNDGTTVCASGKAVHARIMGSGGTLYNIAVDTSEGVNNIRNINGNIPSEYKLEQNYPNPFNPNTTIRFQIKDLSFVSLIIYNTLGKGIATLVNEEIKPGTYEVKWDASQYPSGMYFYKLSCRNFSETKKLILVK
jgi:hypothetical protein